MPFKFNETLWKIGQKIEDDTLPLINEYYDCDFKRNENDIFDILDFHDKVRFTGTNCIKHYCIPVKSLTEINKEEDLDNVD